MQESVQGEQKRKRDRFKRGFLSAFRPDNPANKAGPASSSGGCEPSSPAPSIAAISSTTKLETQIQSLNIHDQAVIPTISKPPSYRATSTKDLWAVALQNLPDEERAAIAGIDSDSKLDVLERLSDEVRQKRDQCKENRWKFEFNGRQIILQDVAEKAIVWINKFKEIGDIAVQYDPVHAALPWAGVRFLLQMITVGSQQMSAILFGVEKVASIISRCKIYELLYLDSKSSEQAMKNLESALLAAYTLILLFLATVYRLYQKNSTTRALHGILNPDKIASFVEKCEKNERRIESEARNCESIYIRGAVNKSTERVEGLKQLLLSFEQPLCRLDSRVATMFTRLEESRQSEILRWISPIPYKDSHTSARSGRTQGTGSWLLEHSHFCEWQNSSSSTILWLHGFPGAGKTKLVSTVVDDLLRSLSGNTNDEALAYFYCDRNRVDYQNPTSILSSFVRQLSISRDEESVQGSSVQLYDQKRKAGFASSQLSFGESQTQIHTLTENYPQTNLVLDALDECDKSTRTDLVQCLNSLINQSSRLIKIFISSRPDPDLRIQFEHGPNMEIRAVDNHDDIVKHVDSTITNGSSPPFWRNRVGRELRQRVCETLVSRSEGMFQWVALQILQLHALSRERDIELRLGKLPKTLEKAYDEIFGRIQAGEGSAPEVADRAFKWIMSSEEPMSPLILVAAVCQDPETDNIDAVDVNIDYVLESCQNLVVVENIERQYPKAEHQICRFSHLSVQEYLENDYVNLNQTNRLLAKVCLVVLNDPVLQETPQLEAQHIDETEETTEYAKGIAKNAKFQDNQFYDLNNYARTYWVIHVQKCGEDSVDNRVVTLLSRFLGAPAESAQAYRRWYEASEERDIRTLHRGPRYDSLLSRLEPTSLASLPVAMFGLHQILQDWWELIDIEQQNDRGETLLVLAIIGGCRLTVQALLDKGADVNAWSGDTTAQSPLYAASSMGDEAVVRLLVARGAIIENKGGSCGNALQAASDAGREAVVKLLLQEGADINARGERPSNALEAASGMGHEATVKLLLKEGADINTQGGLYGNALQTASVTGTEAVVKLLLKEGADVNTQGGIWGNALQAASGMRQEAIAKLLLKEGADINAQGGYYGNALQAASVRRNEAIVKLLLKEGADVNAQGGYYGNALQAASDMGYKAIVRLLLDAGAVDQNGKALERAANIAEDSE